MLDDLKFLGHVAMVYLCLMVNCTVLGGIGYLALIEQQWVLVVQLLPFALSTIVVAGRLAESSADRALNIPSLEEMLDRNKPIALPWPSASR